MADEPAETAEIPPEGVPAGLGPVGQALYVDLRRHWDFAPDEMVTLVEICACADELARLRVELWRSPVSVTGSQGQPRPNPLFTEVREHRALLSKLLGQLRVPKLDVDTVLRPGAASDAARDLVSHRWNRRNGGQ